ncbi:hypothetical protein [Cytobacillus dafuensis]|uniref:Uncharacterized protein n=1 Tax=Cytobacillus dafuensis TaxID=1742359 RepID=A0A5B8Z8Y2_CYTDA|nr:hypothetical protein [Cytobacillus dafuensis]QED48169.1 hypothetical protein FSZ17_13505 [Cytobacillus dafuensis]
MFLIMAILNSFSLFVLVSFIVNFFGNTIKTRLAKVVLIPASIILYFYVLNYAVDMGDKLSLFTNLAIILGPFVILIILKIVVSLLSYIMGWNTNKQSQY